MIKKTVQLRSLMDKYDQNCNRIREIADLCEKENRERSESETTEYETLTRENQILQMKVQALQSGHVRSIGDPDVMLRETLASKQEAKIVLQRDIQTSAALEGTGIIPVAEQEMLKPLRSGLIYDKVGLNVRTGLTAGKLRWPKHTKAVASFADEAEALTDSKIDFSKLEVKPERLGVAIPVTREELESSEGLVESVISEEMPAAIVDKVNAAMFTTDGAGKKVYGPFVEAAKNAVQFAGDVPTRKELLKMKAKVAGSGIKMVAPCWVMTENMKAELEDLKADSGSGRFVCEEDKIFGYPVFTTPEIGEGNIGFGDWSYQAAGFFGAMSVIVDPYTLARKNATDFVLNTHFATVTLYQEAFVLGKVKAATASSSSGTTSTGGSEEQ